MNSAIVRILHVIRLCDRATCPHCLTLLAKRTAKKIWREKWLEEQAECRKRHNREDRYNHPCGW